jgi:predicted RNA methylase
MACEAIDEKLDSPTYDVVLADISQMPLPCHPIFDIVVMNPPFGTKEAGIDMKFLEFATKTC